MAKLAGRQFGVVSVHELRRCGLSSHQVFDRVKRGHLHQLHCGVYAVGHTRLQLEAWFLAAVKACGPRAVLSHFAAATLWAFVEWDGRAPEVTVLGDVHRRHDGVLVHRTQCLDRADVRFRQGIPLTSPARTCLDLGMVLDEREHRSAVRRAQSRDHVTIPELAEVLRRLAPRRGCAALRRIIATGRAPTRTVLEDVVLDLILSGGLVRPDVNVPIAGTPYIPDFRWPEQRLIVEADSRAWHDNPLARADDAERQAVLEARGERLVRVTWRQAIDSPARTLQRLRKAGAPTAG